MFNDAAPAGVGTLVSAPEALGQAAPVRAPCGPRTLDPDPDPGPWTVGHLDPAGQ